jgi:hypothetical protein
MPISIACPHCDWKGRVPDNLAGRKGKCPTCGELVPIPKKGTPPPVPVGQKAAVDDEPDLVDDADVVEDEPRPAAKRPAPARRPVDDDDDDRPSRSRRRADDDDEDDRPRKARRRDDDEDERPARSRRRVDEDDEDDEEDDRPRRSKRLADDDDRPRRPRKKRRRKESEGGPNTRMIAGGFVMLFLMIVWWVVGLVFFDLCFYYPPIGGIIACVAIIRGLMGKSD